MAHFAIQPLLAADAWQTIVGLLIFILWSVLQWLGNRNEAKQKQNQKPRRPRPPQPVDVFEGGAEGRKPPARNQEDALRSEVEDFLRRAQGKPAREQPFGQARPQQPSQRPPQPERQQPYQQDEPRTLVSKAERTLVSNAERTGVSKAQSTGVSKAQSTGVSKAQRTEPPRRPTRSQQVATEGQNLRQEGVAEHVAKHLNTQDIVDHISTLGETVGLADERLESRLHEKFDHDLGLIRHRDRTSDAKKPRANDLAIGGVATGGLTTGGLATGGLAMGDLATEVAAMLSEPAGMRKLIIANEILRRPDW